MPTEIYNMSWSCFFFYGAILILNLLYFKNQFEQSTMNLIKLTTFLRFTMSDQNLKTISIDIYNIKIKYSYLRKL